MGGIVSRGFIGNPARIDPLLPVDSTEMGAESETFPHLLKSLRIRPKTNFLEK